jgi:hypothetical protein
MSVNDFWDWYKGQLQELLRSLERLWGSQGMPWQVSQAPQYCEELAQYFLQTIVQKPLA